MCIILYKYNYKKNIICREDKTGEIGKQKRKKEKSVSEGKGTISETAPNPESTLIVNVSTTTAGDDDGTKLNSQNSSKKRRLKEESKVKIKKRKVQDSGDLSLKGDPSDNCETDNAMVKKKQIECKLLTSETQSLTGGVSETIKKSESENEALKQGPSKASDDIISDVKKNELKNKKKKKKKKKKLPKLSDERLLAYGINPKKLRYMKTDNFKHKTKVKE